MRDASNISIIPFFLSYFLCICLSVYVSVSLSRTHTHSAYPTLYFSLSHCFRECSFSLVKSAQAQLNLINLWVVQVSDHFPSQIWTSPVTLQSIKPNYPHYKDHQIPLSNPFSFPRQHRLSLMQTAHVGFGSDVILIWIPQLHYLNMPFT